MRFINGNAAINDAKRVLCDICGKDWTHRRETGGMLLRDSSHGAYAGCPDCQRDMAVGGARHGQHCQVMRVCPPDVSFADFVRAERHADDRWLSAIVPRRGVLEKMAAGLCFLAGCEHTIVGRHGHRRTRFFVPRKPPTA